MLTVLPTCVSKAQSWRDYRAASSSHLIVPHVVVGRPMSDLCWVCQRNNSHILRAVNIPEEMKAAILLTTEPHLHQATSFCLSAHVRTGKAGHRARQIRPSPLYLPPQFLLCSTITLPSQPSSTRTHLLQDCTQSPAVRSPCCGSESTGELPHRRGKSASKGANIVMSLHHCIVVTYGVGEANLQLHADNRAGQNKNNHTMRYLMWCLTTRLHQSACIGFTVAGQMKFVLDWCFGLLKRTTRRTSIVSLADIEAACKASSICSHARCVGTQDGQTLVRCYDW